MLQPAGKLDAVHSFEPANLERLRPDPLGFRGFAALLTVWMTWRSWRTGSVAATTRLMFLVALLPVLNIIPIGFAVSLYHDRFVMLALACIACAAPMVSWPKPHVFSAGMRSILVASVFIAWIAMGLLTIRATLPRWMSDESLWRSAIAHNSTNEIVQYNLTASLLRSGRVGEAAAYADRFSYASAPCARCDIETASASLDQGDAERAATLVERAARSTRVRDDLDVRAKYHRVAGELALAEGAAHAAVMHLERAASLRPHDPVVHVLVAEAFASLGDSMEARQAAATALAAARESDRQAIQSWHEAFNSRLPHEQPAPDLRSKSFR